MVFDNFELEGLGVQTKDSASRCHESYSLACWNRNRGTTIESGQESVSFLFQAQAAEAANMNHLLGAQLALDGV
jgi:hypothetical protein